VRSIRLLSNNPRKLAALQEYGIAISERVPLLVTPNAENLPYLRTKRARMDHYLPNLDAFASTESSSPKESSRLASTPAPFAAEAREGRPITPDVV
jgi:hypothetical protein